LSEEEFNHHIADITYCGVDNFDFEDLDYEDCRNRFDETCQGTVPVAFDIILKSDSFEEAIRLAVSLGADADTLGAIVGSIAEHIWGIPDYMVEKAMSYLPDEMQQIVKEFYVKCNERPTYKPRRVEKETQEKDGFKAMMHWKLGLGNFNNIMRGESLLPNKERIATSADWDIKPMPESKEETSTIKLAILIPEEAMAILR
jgi:hypothetical protein